MFNLSLHRGRTIYETIKLYEADGTTSITLDVTDVVRFKVYRDNAATPVIEIQSGSNTANGSSLIIQSLTGPAKAQLRIAQGDTANLEPGIYNAEISIVDDSETAPTDAIKHAESGTVYVLSTPGGNVGLTTAA